MSTHSHTLASHGEILANLPGILGFYPNNSLILAFFVDDEGADTIRLGPVARFDLDEAVEKLTESRERFAAWVHHLELDAVIAYMISDDIAQPVFDETATYLTSGAVHLPPLLGVVQVPEIVTGAAWWSVYQHPFIDDARARVRVSRLQLAGSHRSSIGVGPGAHDDVGGVVVVAHAVFLVGERQVERLRDLDPQYAELLREFRVCGCDPLAEEGAVGAGAIVDKRLCVVAPRCGPVHG